MAEDGTEKRVARYRWCDAEKTDRSLSYFNSLGHCLAWMTRHTGKRLTTAEPLLWWPIVFFPDQHYHYMDDFTVAFDDRDGSVAGYILRWKAIVQEVS